LATIHKHYRQTGQDNVAYGEALLVTVAQKLNAVVLSPLLFTSYVNDTE